MNKRIFIFFILILLSVPAMALDLEHVAIQQDDITTLIKEYRTRLAKLEKAGYGGPTLRKDLGDLADSVMGRFKDLDELRRMLEEVGMPAGKAKIMLKATRETYDGPPLQGKAEVGEIIALQAELEIPGDPNLPVSSYLTWQLLDANRQQVGEYYKQEETYDVGALTNQVRFLLQDIPPGEYYAVLTHQFAQTPDASSQGFVKFAVDRPIYIVDSWVTNQKDGQPIQAELGYGEPAIFYVTFKLEQGVEKVNINLRAKDADTGKEISLQVVDYERKPDQNLQRVGMMVQPHALKSVGGIEFTAELSEMRGDKFGPTISADAVAKIYKPIGSVTVSLPDEMISGKMYRLTLGVPSDFKAPYKVEVEADGMRFKQSSDTLRGTIKGFASDTSSYRSFSVMVTDARGFKAEGKSMTKVIPKEVAEARDAPPPSTVASSGGGYSGGGGTEDVSMPTASGSGCNPELGRNRINAMVNYLEGLCAACNGAFACDEIVRPMVSRLRQQDPAEIGCLSESQVNEAVRQWATIIGQRYVQNVRDHFGNGFVNYAYKRCVERTFGTLEGEGFLPPGTGGQVIASIEGSGSGGGGSSSPPPSKPSVSSSSGGSGGSSSSASRGYICVVFTKTSNGKTRSRMAVFPNDAQGQNMAKNGRIAGTYESKAAAKRVCGNWSSARGVGCGQFTK